MHTCDAKQIFFWSDVKLKLNICFMWLWHSICMNVPFEILLSNKNHKYLLAIYVLWRIQVFKIILFYGSFEYGIIAIIYKQQQIRILIIIWSRYFLLKLLSSIFIFSPNDSPSKTMKNNFYFIWKSLFVFEIFRFWYFFPFRFTLSRFKRTNETEIIYDVMKWLA